MSIRCCIVSLVVASVLPSIVRGIEVDASLEHFEKKVRPLLAEHCWTCHGADDPQAGLRLDSGAGVQRGSEFGPVVIPGRSDQSRLVQVVRRTGDIKMPPDEALSDSQIADLVAWIDAGATWPAATPTRASAAPANGSLFTEEETSYWAFQPVRDPAPPVIKEVDWVQSDLDQFILAKLKSQGLAPAAPADKRTLLRRVTFDLIGLPPTPEEMAAFLADESTGAFATVVERLLGSRHYGERWGRRWLDVVRYGDTADIPGHMFSLYAYRYRDYVVNAFNHDKPYDDFIVEQLAGDLMESVSDEGRNAERVIATGFLMLGPKSITEIDKERMVMQLVEEQIDVTSRTFLGLTVACARCHDHKFDPIPTHDYYSLAGIFYSTQSMFDRKQVDSKWMERPLEHVPGESGPVMVLAVQDGEPKNLRVNIRGSHRNLGEEVPRRFLQILAGENHDPIETQQSGRLELARWIARADNPLTARVMVNRIWQGHFGRGLVSTSDNFGVSGQRPTHPDLLDWLASRFIESGWSIKALHRLMLNSATYQQGSQLPNVEPGRSRKPTVVSRSVPPVDPENLLLWRMSPRRLEAEEIRDAILAANGQLDPTFGGTLLGDYARYVDTFVDIKRGILATQLIGRTFHPYFSRRRSIYLPMVRQRIPEIFHVFDFGDASTVTAKRGETTVAPQALFMMNSWFVREQSFHLAKYLISLDGVSDEDRVRIAYERLLSRPATDGELASAMEYVSRVQDSLEEASPPGEQHFSQGATLTVTARRAPHRRAVYEELKPVLENPSGVRLRISATASPEVATDLEGSPEAWEVFSPVSATIENGTSLEIAEDGTVIIPGDNPTNNFYQIVVETRLQRLAAVRLEVLPDPEQSPERSIPDLFVLSEFQVHASPRVDANQESNESRAIAWQHATLLLSTGNQSAMPLIDDNPATYWHIGPNRDQAGVVVFEVADHRVAAWESWCRAMFCLNEFVYLE